MLANFSLALAILTEAIGTSALRATEGFTQFWPVVLVLLSYGFSFYFLSLSLKSIAIGIAYAIWSGVGIILITLFAGIFYKQIPTLLEITGMSLIIAGVVLLNIVTVRN